jgi:hypothetical protein
MSLIRSKKRVADHGEVFTPSWLVEAMLDLVKGETERIDSRFLEPACGSGNFLVRVLQRKLASVVRSWSSRLLLPFDASSLDLIFSMNGSRIAEGRF